MQMLLQKNARQALNSVNSLWACRLLIGGKGRALRNKWIAFFVFYFRKNPQQNKNYHETY